MKILIIGKYPPIQGGVSARTYWLAHDFASAGHEIHVVTNAKDVKFPYRITMLDEDWNSCEKEYPSGGKVQVHWTDPDLAKQYHIPWHNPFVTKIASLSLDVIEEYRIELIFSYYLEPYGVAGYIASKLSGLPHVIKHAGSDVGRLWKQKDFKKLYTCVLAEADVVLTGKVVAEQLIKAGIQHKKIALGLATKLPSIFNSEKINYPDWLPAFPAGAMVIGVYGKLGLRKGTFDLLAAISILNKEGYQVRLLIVGHGENDVQLQFEKTLDRLSIKNIVVQLPFIPNWRIPTFIKSCDAICFLEQNFPISFHAPNIAQEVLACGKALICSVEILQKQQQKEKFISGFNCFAVSDVTDHAELSQVLKTLFKLDRKSLDRIGKNGLDYYMDCNKQVDYPNNFLSLFESVVSGNFSPNIVNNTLNKSFNFIWIEQIIRIYKNFFSQEKINLEKKPLRTIINILQFIKSNSSIPNKNVLCELLFLEKQLYVTLNKQTLIKAPYPFKKSLSRLGNFKIDKLDDSINLIKLKLRNDMLVRKYQYNVNQMLQARLQKSIPTQIDKKISYVLSYPRLIDEGVGITILSEETYLLLMKFNGKKTTKTILDESHNISNQNILDFVKLGLLTAI